MNILQSLPLLLFIPICTMELKRNLTRIPTPNITTITIPSEKSPSYTAIKNLVHASKTLKTSLSETGSQFEQGLEIPLNITQKQLETLLELADKNLLDNKAQLIQYFKKASVQELINFLNTADYLDLSPPLEIAKSYITERILLNPAPFKNISSALNHNILEKIRLSLADRAAPYIHYATFECHKMHFGSATVSAVAFSTDGTMIASGLSDGTVILWNVTTKIPTQKITNQTSGIASLAFPPDGKTIISASYDGTINFLNLSDLSIKKTATIHSDEDITAIRFSPDCSIFAYGIQGSTTHLVDSKTGFTFEEIDPKYSFYMKKYDIIFNSNGNKIAFFDSYSDNAIKVYDLTRKSFLNTIKSDEPFYSCAFSPNGKKIACGLKNGLIRLIDLQDNFLNETIVSHTYLHRSFRERIGHIFSIAFSPDGNKLVAGLNTKNLELWQRDMGISFEKLITHIESITSHNFKRQIVTTKIN